MTDLTEKFAFDVNFSRRFCALMLF